MCAINGFNFKDRELVEKMNAVTKHRGPDDTGIFSHDEVTLGHNRLSIIDPSASANQPMKSASGRYTIVFNGEIYNFRELKEQLPDYPFKTKSDTEVILAGYEEWGKQAVEYLDGIFAFAIWDSEQEELILARDPVGVKPLYYYRNGESLIFSSEIKGILEHDIPRVLDREAFSHYMRILYVPEPLTMFERVRKFPKSSYGVLKGKEFSIKKYNQKDSFKEKVTSEVLRKVILQNVEKQLVSDRPLGIYLSGGIDSSAILDCVASVRGNIDTFSVGFELRKGEEQEKFNADFDLARQTAERYKTNHHEVVVSPSEILPLWEEAIYHLDEPISNPTFIPMLKLSRFAKEQGVDVVLGGDGGDELFGGYERYRQSLMVSWYQKIVSEFIGKFFVLFHPIFRKLNIRNWAERYGLFFFQKDKVLGRVLQDEFFYTTTTKDFFEQEYLQKQSNKSFEEVFMETDRKTWLADQSLVASDKLTMANGLEQRVPLLGRDVVAMSTHVPLSQKVTFFNTKKILKEAFRGRIPDFLYSQPKRGWFSPGAKWLRYEEVRKFAGEVLSPDYYRPTSNMFQWAELQHILEDHVSGREYNLTILWAVVTFQIWAKRYKVEI